MESVDALHRRADRAALHRRAFAVVGDAAAFAAAVERVDRHSEALAEPARRRRRQRRAGGEKRAHGLELAVARGSRSR